MSQAPPSREEKKQGIEVPALGSFVWLDDYIQGRLYIQDKLHHTAPLVLQLPFVLLEFAWLCKNGLSVFILL